MEFAPPVRYTRSTGLLAIDGWGHGYHVAGRSTCADEAMAAYFLDGLLPAAETVCPVDARPFGD